MSTDCYPSGLLELCLDLNQTPSLPASLRYDVATPHQRTTAPQIVAAGISPEKADSLLLEYTAAVKEGRIPPIDLHVVREQVEQQLAVQDVRQVDDLAAGIPHAIPTDSTEYPPEMKGDELPGFFTSEQETEYLLRQDAKLGDRLSLSRLAGDPQKDANGNQGDKNSADLFSDLTPRELERQLELLNPQSQHNWLRTHNKINGMTDGDDTESLASHDTPKASRKRGGAGAKNLAKQVGDRALERAREGFSPGAASGMGEEDELAFVDENPGSSKKRGKDPDGTYRVKGGKSGGRGGKRKRASGEGADGAKKARVDLGE